MCIYKHTHTHIYIHVCVDTCRCIKNSTSICQLRIDFKFIIICLYLTSKIFASRYFRQLDSRVRKSSGWVGGTHLLSKFSGACWAPPRASLPASPSASHRSQSCRVTQLWPRWHLLCLQILHSPRSFQRQDRHLSIVQNDWRKKKKKR